MAKVSKQLIIDAAVRQFYENGYHATSMRDIAQVLKIRKASLYHHFDSKEDILLTILKLGVDTLLKDLEAIAQTELDPVAKLQAAIMAHVTAIGENPEGAAVFMREDRGLGDKYLTEYLAKRDQFEGIFRSIVKQGIDEGLLRETDITITVHALMGMVNWMTRWYKPGGRLPAEEIAEMFTALFLDGLIAQPQPTQQPT